MASSTRIRDTERGDLAAIAELEAAAFPSPWKLEFFASELVAPSRYNRVVVDASVRLFGYVFAMYFADEMHINKIAVVEAARRLGIATELMADCASFARSHHVATISLEVRQSNEVAQAFYRKLAFQPLYVRPRYYPDGEGAIVMIAHL
jgi:[ribosomal protein S18]-alanine N-acetyltransferase